MLIQAALYARVSSDRQVQTHTIDSQIMVLQEQIKADGHLLLKEFEFIDDGYSGSILTRPGLERLRDAAANHLVDKIYVHSPDRLARKYAYQYLLIEEFKRLNIAIIFLNNQIGDNPESDLLLQVQGIISEYERTKIMERSRRGKLHAAKRGSPSVLSGAPYGYRYTAKRDNGIALYEIVEKEAEVIRLLFTWVGHERMSINAATKRLTEKGFKTPTGKNNRWNRGSVHHMLRNPAYKGMAAFGKTKCVAKKTRLRAYRGHSLQTKSSCSLERLPKEQWISISVPPIVAPDLFDIVQEQLEENKRLKRARATGVRYLLQGLIVCKLCGYGYHGNTATHTRKHNYYSCGGTRVYANRDRMCNNQSVHADFLEQVVWAEVKFLLNNPFYLEKEYKRRIKELNKTSNGTEHNKLLTEKIKLEKTIIRLIDSYAEALIDKTEFEPRVKNYKRKLFDVEQQLVQFTTDKSQQEQLQTVMRKMEVFSENIRENLEKADWKTQRDIVTALIKQVEIGEKDVMIVFRVDPYLEKSNHSIYKLEDCRRSTDTNIANLFAGHIFYLTTESVRLKFIRSAGQCQLFLIATLN